MGQKQNTVRSVLLIVFCIIVIAGISVFFISQMNKTIENNTMNTISELAEHDRISIQNFVEKKWYELHSIYLRFLNYKCDTIQGVQERMNLERASSDFYNLYMVAEDGSVYTDRYMVYPKEEMDISKYLGQGDEQIVKRYDYRTTTEHRKETLLYMIPLENYTVEGIKFVAFAGVTNITQIQSEIMISSFNQGGKSRGYSSVVNQAGDYIVNTGKTVSLNQQPNLYRLLDRGTVDASWTKEAIQEKMRGRETFSIDFEDVDGEQKLFYFMPIETTGWYFMSMVEKGVFQEQSHSFIFLSMTMLLMIILIIIVVLFVFMASRNKVIKVSAETKAKSAFLSNMSHEIRTPLNGVIGMLHLMRTHVRDNDSEKMEEWIDKAHATANYLLSLVSNILDMTKFEEGKLELMPEPFMIESMIDEIWTMQHSNIEENGIEFIVKKDITVPCVVGDAIRIK